ncbi:hypothetical protein Pint_14083 [Pistacia integerrima]|uniref:Uncharacterized protein n=1 Tax=Pistacia integerrima TaxID=434235 RepID=A0ACC0Y5I2_9ROSI|nr:hypothetical protein Pint_14083 [Pistacia integerrima]
MLNSYLILSCSVVTIRSIMALQYIIFQQFSLFLLGTVSVYANFGYPALPNCPNQCGNVTISYPFGIGSGCSKDESFSIICSTSFNPPKPLLTNPQAEILEINLPGGSMRVNSEIYSSCSGLVNISKNLGDNPYLFYSENGNRFTALGCGVQATISENNELIGGCMSICNDESHASSSSSGASCYGITCCQAMIPYGLKNFTLSVSGTNKDGSYETCKYAFLVDQDWFLNQTFSYPFYYMPSDLFPVVLDWKFSANETCKICGPNAICSVNQSCFLLMCQRLCGEPISSTRMHSGDGRRGGIGCVENKQWVRTAIIGASAGLGLLLVILGALWSHKVMKEDRKEELMAVAYIAKRCLYLNGRDRPSMREVAMELEGIMISKGYLSTDQKQDITNAKMLTEIGECSSISTGTYSLMCSESSKDVHSLKLHTI